MRPLIRSRVANAAMAATVAGVAGIVALVTIALFYALGQPWGTLNDVAFVVEVLAIAPLMLGSYELGGVTPLWPARLSLAGGIAACLVWAVIHLAFIAGIVSFDYEHAATGAFLVENVALVVIGLWLSGAPPLAGPWLPAALKVLGALGGLGFVFAGLGLILGGMDHPLAWIGGVGYLILFPIWALLVARVFRTRIPAG
ncbi:MAG TPA: hypothetical protein VF484_02650 [Candidatus Limnocylindrales bacterium]